MNLKILKVHWFHIILWHLLVCGRINCGITFFNPSNFLVIYDGRNEKGIGNKFEEKYMKYKF